MRVRFPGPTRQRLAPHQVRRCLSEKVGYATREEALIAAERMMEMGKVRPGCHIMPYVCEDCHEFHVANHIIVPMRGH